MTQKPNLVSLSRSSESLANFPPWKCLLLLEIICRFVNQNRGSSRNLRQFVCCSLFCQYSRPGEARYTINIDVAETMVGGWGPHNCFSYQKENTCIIVWSCLYEFSDCVNATSSIKYFREPFYVQFLFQDFFNQEIRSFLEIIYFNFNLNAKYILSF